MLEIKNSSNSPFIHYYSIDSIDEEYLKMVEVWHNDTGEIKWFLIDKSNKITPVFNNESNIIALPNNSCMFVGKHSGNYNLYYVQTEDENEEMYRTIDLSIEPTSIEKYDDNHIIVKGNDGALFFNLTLMNQSSEVFDDLITDQIEDTNYVLFEKNIEYMDIKKKIIGTVSSDGKIGNFVYDDLEHCIKSSPKISSINEYDKIDNERILDNMKKVYDRLNHEKDENVKKLIRINRLKKNDF